jgi:hypothetical protein
MKGVARIMVVLFIAVCLCYYFDVDVKGIIDTITGRENTNNSEPDKGGNDKGTAVISQVPSKTYQGGEGIYNEIMNFLINQKKDRKLIESFRVLDKIIGGDLKGRSYIGDDALAVIAMINHNRDGSSEAALDILKNLASIQNKDGSWFDMYDTSGKNVKVSGKDYTKCDTGNNSWVLYAYSYYTMATGDTQFMEVMGKSADFLLSRFDSKTGGVYDQDVSSKGVLSLKGNTYCYFALRDYALLNIKLDYGEYKEKAGTADHIALWIIKNCFDKGIFSKEYSNGKKSTVLDLESQIIGAIFMDASIPGKAGGFEYKDLEASLQNLYKDLSGFKGYRIDNGSKNAGYIWCEGTCMIPIAGCKYGQEKSLEELLGFIGGYQAAVSNSLVPRGVPSSTNVDNKLDKVNLESVRASSWSAIAFQCFSEDEICSRFMGSEEFLFRKLK